MTQYAQFDSTAPQPAQVTGWYDTAFVSYPNLPSSNNLLVVTSAQWAAHMANPSGWAVQDGALVAYTPPVVIPTAAQVAQTAFNNAVSAGVTINSTGSPAIDGTYALDQVSLGRITSEQVYISVTGKFTNGQTTRAWFDIAGAPHTFPSTTEFTAFAEAVAQYEDALITALAVGLAGGAWVAPAMPATLA